MIRARQHDGATAAKWPPGFLEQLRTVDADTAEAVDELSKTVSATRRSKPPIRREGLLHPHPIPSGNLRTR
jgi:hypothetical protein